MGKRLCTPDVTFPVEPLQISSVADAMEVICAGLNGHNYMFPPATKHLKKIFDAGDTAGREIPSRYKFPFGVWFRGSGFGCHPLTPSLFHHEQASTGWCNSCRHSAKKEHFDEVSMVRHFRSVAPHYQRDHTSLFDWLCLMQHYSLPTRLLDWSENILIALYFAVRVAGTSGSPQSDGMIYALNGARLNQISRLDTARRMLLTPESGDVLIRSALSQTRTRSGLKKVLIECGWYRSALEMPDRYVAFRTWLEQGQAPSDDRGNIEERLGYPVAVLPNRLNERLRAQQGAFTLHGGRVCDPRLLEPDSMDTKGSWKVRYRNEFPAPWTLMDLNRCLLHGRGTRGEKRQFLLAFRVPKERKKIIREQLKRIGIHEASVFPELDRQGFFLRKQWLVADDEDGRLREDEK